MSKTFVTTPEGIQEGEDMAFSLMGDNCEDWHEYRCSDGAVVRMKTVVTKIIRLPKKDPEGNPIYFTKSLNMVDARIPGPTEPVC